MNRQGFIGGSDIAAILGVSPWKTAYELWEEEITGSVEESTEARDKVIRRGKKLEPLVIEMLQEEKDVWVLDRNQVHIDHEHPFLRAEIDFEYAVDNDPDKTRGNGDVKTVHPYAAKDWGEEGTDEFPVYYCAQFQFGLMVTGRQVCMVAALIGADDLRVYEVKRDEELIAFIRKTAVDFWHNHIIANVPPPVQTAEDAAKMLKRFQGFAIEADEVTAKNLRIIKGIKAAEKRLEAKRETFELSVKTRIVQAAVDKGVEGDSEKYAIVGADGKPLCTWNSQSATRIDVKKLRASLPEVAEEYSDTSTFRVLRLK